MQVSAYLMNLENTAWQDRDKTSRFNLELRQVDGGLHLSTQAEHEDPRFQPAGIIGVEVQQSNISGRELPDDPILGQVYFRDCLLYTSDAADE